MKRYLFIFLTMTSVVCACEGEKPEDVITENSSGDTGDFTPEDTFNRPEAVILQFYYD